MNSMLGGLKNKIVGGEPILSHTISLKTVESEIANSLTKVQNDNQDVEIGSYPFFHAGKLGVSIVMRCEDQSKIDLCSSQILEFVNYKDLFLIGLHIALQLKRQVYQHEKMGSYQFQHLDCHFEL